MRVTALMLAGLLATSAAVSTSAAPAIPNPAAVASANLIQVSGGCGPAYHRNPWGYCVPNPYNYYYTWYGYPRAYAWHYYRPYHWHY